MKFFSSILKQKKIATFALLFLVITTIMTPQIAFAQGTWWNPLNWGDNLMNSILNGIMIAIVTGPLIVIMAFVSITNLLLTLVITLVTTGTSYTHGDAVNIGWPIVRDLANMMVVLGFVVIGIATTLRIQDYQAKKTLLPLIIAALLINFSLLITGIFIDASNIVMIFFFDKAGNSVSNWVPGVSSLLTLLSSMSASNVLEFAPKLLGLMFFNFLAGFISLLYMLLLLLRMLILWMLVILSPLAFVCYVFPATRSIWQMWWKNFFQWCIIVLPAGLFYFIGSKMISNNPKPPAPNLTIPGFVEYITGSVGTVLVPGLFLIAGFLVSLQFSAIGASAIMNFANKNKDKILSGGLGALNKAHTATTGKVMGAAGNKMSQWGSSLEKRGDTIGKVGGWVVNKAGQGAQAMGDLRASSQKTRSAYGRGLEAIGARDTGTTDMKQAGIVEEEAKMIKFNYSRAKASGDTKTVKRIQSDAMAASERRGGSKSAASMKVITDAGDLHETFKDPATNKINLAKTNEALTYAAKEGAIDIRKEAVKTTPELERQNTSAIKKIKDQHPGWSDSQAEHEAVVRAARKVAPENLDRNFIETNNFKVIADAGERMTRKQKEELKNNIPDIRQEMDTVKPGASGANPTRFLELAQKYAAINRIKI